MNKRFRLLPVVLAFAGLAAACSASYDRAEFIDQIMEDSGLDEAVATCIADGVEAQIPEDRLNSSGDDLTAEEQEIVTSVAFECALAGG